MIKKPSKGQIGWALVVVAALLATLFFGVNYPIPEPPAETGPVIESRAAGNLDIVRALRVENYLENFGTLTQAGAVTLTGPLQGGSPLVLEGATDNAYETTLAVTDPTADRTVTLPNMSGTVLVTNTPKILAFGTNTVTTTLTLSHGIVGPTQVFCTLTQDSEANGATCSSTISSDTIVLKLWKADGATAGSVGKQIAWMVVGPGQ